MKILRKGKIQGCYFYSISRVNVWEYRRIHFNLFAYKYDLIQSLNTWLHGDFSMIMSGRYELIYLSIPLVILAYLYANKFTVAGMGEEFCG